MTLYPVFTLTTNYPLIAITLRNNLSTLVDSIPYFNTFRFKTIVLSFVAAVPAIPLAFATQNLSELVHITGGFAGLLIEFVVPTLLVIFARRKLATKFDQDAMQANPHRSPFYHWIWLATLLVFSFISLIYNTVTTIMGFIYK